MPRLEPGMARIRIKDLRLRTYIGINEDEILNKQDVLGIFSYVLLIAKQALFSPQRFFSNIDPKL